MRNKREKTQIINIRTGTRDVTTVLCHLKDRKAILKQLYKLNNLGEMDQVLKDQKLLQLNQDEIDNLKSSYNNKKKSKPYFFKSSLGKEFSYPDGEFYQTFEKLAPILHNVFLGNERGISELIL